MADIAMCAGRNCAVRRECYRHRAVSDGDHQTFGPFDRKPVDTAAACDRFWALEKAEGPLAE